MSYNHPNTTIDLFHNHLCAVKQKYYLIKEFFFFLSNCYSNTIINCKSVVVSLQVCSSAWNFLSIKIWNCQKHISNFFLFSNIFDCLLIFVTPLVMRMQHSYRGRPNNNAAVLVGAEESISLRRTRNRRRLDQYAPVGTPILPPATPTVLIRNWNLWRTHIRDADAHARPILCPCHCFLAVSLLDEKQSLPPLMTTTLRKFSVFRDSFNVPIHINASYLSTIYLKLLCGWNYQIPCLRYSLKQFTHIQLPARIQWKFFFLPKIIRGQGENFSTS